MLRLLRFLPLALPTLISCAMHSPAPSADLTVTNARIWTGNPSRPWAQALAVRGDRIVTVGSGAEVAKLSTAATTVIDAKGQFVVPGFIDSHVHFVTSGAQLAGAMESATDQSRKLDADAKAGRVGEVTAPELPEDVRPVNQETGEGIGLSIVKRQCDLLNGSVQLESAIEAGMKFRMHFP
jgi:hypothetical protein